MFVPVIRLQRSYDSPPQGRFNQHCTSVRLSEWNEKIVCLHPPKLITLYDHCRNGWHDRSALLAMTEVVETSAGLLGLYRPQTTSTIFFPPQSHQNSKELGVFDRKTNSHNQPCILVVTVLVRKGSFKKKKMAYHYTKGRNPLLLFICILMSHWGFKPIPEHYASTGSSGVW